MQKIESTRSYLRSHSQRGGIKLAYVFPTLVIVLASFLLFSRFGFLQFLSFLGIGAIVIMWAKWSVKKEIIPEVQPASS